MELKDINYPSFFLFPYHTDRTAWKPFGLPMILVVPHAKERSGRRITNSMVTQARIYISEKGKAPVAGHDHIGMFIPDYDIYSITLSQVDLGPRLVSMNNVTFVDANGQEGTGESGYIKFTTRSGITGQVQYLEHADYYDLSDISVPTEQLPTNRYILTYEAVYYRRTISENDELLCIDPEKSVSAKYRFLMNHPGEVIMMMLEGTPSLYFGQAKRSEDQTLAFYRPFSEILQDTHDEQNYLERVNWVYNIPPEHVPYLGYILGWDLPYFPRSVDALRRAMLRNIVKLQRLKGSKRAVRELFDLFGFAVHIANIWWTPDGLKYVAPGEKLPTDYADYQVGLTPTVTTEPLIGDFYEDGFGVTTVPLAYRPTQRKVTIRAYVVEAGSAAHSFLSNITDTLSTDFDALDYDPPALYTYLDSAVSDVESMAGVVGASAAFVDTDGYIAEVETAGDAPIFKSGIKIDYTTGVATLNLSKYYNFTSDDTRLFVFATYAYDKITIPESMTHLQSNRFDIELVKKDGEQVDPDVVLFLIDFLMSVKAFHSLLRKIILTMVLSDTYLVTDFCVGGEIEQDPDTDAGQQQVPPGAIIPTTLEGCFAYLPEDYGFRRWDVEYRKRILADLKIEFATWKDLEPLCAANVRGQDRTVDPHTQTTNLTDAVRSDEDGPRQTLCELDGSDYCYIGRPKDKAAYKLVNDLQESWRFKPCYMGLGHGTYYLYDRPGFLGNPVTNPYIGNNLRSPTYKSYLGRLYRSYGRDQKTSLHFTDHRGFDNSQVKSNWLALKRPSLDIQHDNLGFPGHRLPRLDALPSDYTSGTWNAKPWDYPVICGCSAPQYQNPLNARLEIGTDGQEYLVYDELAYSLMANSLTPDISSLGEHEVGTGTNVTSESGVTHSIYGDTTGGHAAVTLQGITQSVGIITVSSPTFQSASDCEPKVDHSDGYPAVTGWISAPSSYTYFPSSSDSAELATGLDVPTSSPSGTFLFTLSSQIALAGDDYEYDFYRHLRLDCGCSKVECATGDTTPNQPTLGGCTISQFLERYGNADNDQVETDLNLVAQERVDCPTFILNNPLSSLFALKQSLESGSWSLDPNGGPGVSDWPPTGSFSYKDAYDTIFEVTWETIGQYWDIVTVKKEPRVWGVSDKSGRLVNREMYRNGIITTTRQVFLDDGTGWRLVAEGSEQVVGEFKSSYLCNSPYSDPFLANLNHNILDEVTHIVTSGPHWTNPDTPSSENVIWADTSGPYAGNEMAWLDIYN